MAKRRLEQGVDYDGWCLRLANGQWWLSSLSSTETQAGIEAAPFMKDGDRIVKVKLTEVE